MAKMTTAKIGDWVRFYRNGVLVIGEVRYLVKRETWERSDTLQADVGEVQAEDVLELRPSGRG